MKNEIEAEVVEEYDHGHQITKVTERECEPTYYFETPLDRMKEFYTLERAKLYDDPIPAVGEGWQR